MTTAEQTMIEVFARLSEDPPLLPGNMDRVRREELTPPGRDGAPAVYLIQGDELVTQAGRADCNTSRALAITVAIFTRADADAMPEADALKAEVHRRLDPTLADHSYPPGVRLVAQAIRTEREVADGMPVRVDMEYEARWSPEGWTL